jgi:DNA repair protein RecO
MTKGELISKYGLGLPAKGEELTVSSIVLRARPYRESDLMAQLLTPTLGKISVIARAARGSKKRFPSSLDIFDRGTARIASERGGGLCVKEFTSARSLTGIRSDLDKLTLASVLCECFDLVIQEEAALIGSAERLFEVLDLALNAIDESEGIKSSLRGLVVALSSLIKAEGIGDLSNELPGSRMLNKALDLIESFAERRLISRTGVWEILARL